jgi:hypothetical protein
LYQERTNTTNNLNNQNGRTNTTAFFNNIIDTFISDYNFSDINNLINNTDASGNNTDNLVILTLLDRINNRTR